MKTILQWFKTMVMQWYYHVNTAVKLWYTTVVILWYFHCIIVVIPLYCHGVMLQNQWFNVVLQW